MIRKIALLTTSFVWISACSINCFLLCSDGTAVQNKYNAARDRCRDYAETRTETDTPDGAAKIGDKTHKAKLVSLFSECMVDEGWSVPDGKDAKATAAATPAPPTAPASPAGATAAPGAPSPAKADNSSNANLAAPVPLSNNAPVMSPEQLAAKEAQKSYVARASECAFARQAAANSTISAARAEACDLECANRLKADPKAQKPAACPTDKF